MEVESTPPYRIGIVVCAPGRPATDSAVWIDVLPRAQIAVRDLVLIDSPRQAVLGIVVGMERIAAPTRARGAERSGARAVTYAKLELVSASDGRQRPPEGTVARQPRPHEVADLLAETRRIPSSQRVPVGVIPVGTAFAPVMLDLHRVVGPTATSVLISGAAGSTKSTGGLLTALGIQHATAGHVALVIVNSKGNDFLFAEYARQRWAERVNLPTLHDRDYAMYHALGYAEPPVLQHVRAFVPAATEGAWQSARSQDFPRTSTYALSREIALRYTAMPSDNDEHPSTIITRQCLEEVAGPFADECGARTLPALVAALETEFLHLGERGRWRNTFLATTVGAALRQLRAALRDLGPILGNVSQSTVFPVDQLAHGGAWVVDVAPLPQRAAQAVYDARINELWHAKAHGVIPHDLPLVLVCDELNRFAAGGPTSAKLAAVVRDQRHRRFALVGIAQDLSTLHPQILQRADARWLGTTRSLELAHDVYAHLPPHVRVRLQRLDPGQRVLDAWPVVQPTMVEVPYPAWLTADEGVSMVDAWRVRQRRARPPQHDTARVTTVNVPGWN